MLKNIFYLFILFSIIASCQKKALHTFEIDQLTLHYDKPASVWEETLPLGNGRLGMMPDGGVEQETIVLNDITMWSGSPENAINEDAIDYLPKIRSLLLKGKNLEAQELMYHHFKCGGKGSAFGNGNSVPFGCSQLLGNLHLEYQYPTSDSITHYKRGLQLKNALAFTQFEKGNTQFMRTYFVSHTNDVMVIHLDANQLNAIGFNLSASRPEHAKTTVENDELIMEGQLNDGKKGKEGVRYRLKVHIKHKGGQLTSNHQQLSLQDANEATIIISASTDFSDKDYLKTIDKLLEDALAYDVTDLKQKHIQKYQEKFNRVELDLGKGNHQIPTNERLALFQTQNNPDFAALYFQFGRYLMISGTRENSLPLNLQGLWSNTVQTPWNGDYHLNINLEMNYWGAEVANLSSLHLPLIEFAKKLSISGAKTAKGFYNADGWVAHVISNPWLFTAPGEHASWGATNTGGAWLCQHLWEHYAFTQDTAYLRSVYPTLTGAATFFLSSMIKEPKHGWWVTAPSSSPENGFYMTDKKSPIYVCMGPTMDVQIIKELFNNILKASSILHVKNKLTKQIQETLPLLPPMQISPKGYLQEWLEDYEETDIHHRHVSHLYGLYPSNQISPYRTPELAEAAKVTLNRRGDDGTGWSRAWKINFWARLHNGDRAYKLLKSLLKPSFEKRETIDKSKGGTYPNLFCAHPPFQIDGNFGGMAGIAEMLLQSQDGFIELLPALPSEWKKGSFKGLRVRGGAEIDLEWTNHQPSSLLIKATHQNTFRLKVPQGITHISDSKKQYKIENGFITLKLKKGEEKRLEMK